MSEHGAAEPDVDGSVTLPEEKFVELKLNHVAFGPHPHGFDTAEAVKMTCLLVCGESETIVTNEYHSYEGWSIALAS